MKYLALLYFSFFISAAAFASDIDSMAADIADKNHSVRAALLSYKYDLESSRQENILKGPEAEFEYAFSQYGNKDNRWGVSIGQTFDWPALYSSRRKATNLRENAFASLYRSELADARFAAKETLIDLAAAAAKLNILIRAANNIDSMAAIIEKQYREGNMTILEYRKIKIEQFSINTTKSSAQTELLRLKAQAEALNNGEELKYIPALDSTYTIHSLEEYNTIHYASNPAFTSRKALREALKEDIKVAKLSNMPSVGISYRHLYEDRTHFNGFGISLSLPSWSRKHEVEAAKIKEENAELDALAFTSSVTAELKANYENAIALSRLIETSRAAFEKNDYIYILNLALEKGKITIIEYFTEYNTYLDTYKDYIDLRKEQAHAVAYLEKYCNL